MAEAPTTPPEPLTEKRIRKRQSSTEAGRKGFKRTRTLDQPRWHNQSYMMFLALRQHTEKSLPRGELIKRALELDKKISAELGLPKVFKGKTPANSASAVLTNNGDHYFIPFKPEGSKSTHFRLAYEPGDTETAIQEYQKWCKKLVEHDWPYCFGIPKEVDDLTQDNHYHTPISDTDSQKNTEETIPKSTTTTTTTTITHLTLAKETTENDSTISTNATTDTVETMTVETTTTKKDTITVDSSTTTNDAVESTVEEDTKESKSTGSNGKKPPLEMEAAPVYTLDQLDLSDIPKHWSDIVEVKPSSIPGAGNGLFAKRKLPYNTPIGFYFGVPMTEDEFDSLKDRVGRSSEYSIMYRRTVLDATDEQGEPVTDPDSARFCAFHFMNETNEAGANVAFVEGVVVNQVICWTRKDIEAGEELLVWYGADVNRYWNDDKMLKREYSVTEEIVEGTEKVSISQQ